jgi:hypothetical protein
VTRNSDLKRLGRRGSYRLGQLRTQGAAPPGPPPPLQPRFRRARHQGLTTALGAALQGLTGRSLGRALPPRSRMVSPAAEAAPDVEADAPHVVVLDAAVPDCRCGTPSAGTWALAAGRRRQPGPAARAWGDD